MGPRLDRLTAFVLCRDDDAPGHRATDDPAVQQPCSPTHLGFSGWFAGWSDTQSLLVVSVAVSTIVAFVVLEVIECWLKATIAGLAEGPDVELAQQRCMLSL